MKLSTYSISYLSLSPITKPTALENIQVYTHEKEAGVIAIDPGSSSSSKPIGFEEESLSKLLALYQRKMQVTKYFVSRRRWLLHRSTFLLLATLLVASILLTLGGHPLAGFAAILIGGMATVGMGSLNIWLDVKNCSTLGALDHELRALGLELPGIQGAQAPATLRPLAVYKPGESNGCKTKGR